MGRKGCGWPCYCWQEVAPFFPDGETEAQGSLGTCPKSLTVSQLLGRGQLALGNKVTQTLVTFPLGSEDRQEGLKGPGLPRGEHLAFLRGSVGGQGEVFAWHWAGPSAARDGEGGGWGGEGRAFWREQHFWQDGHPLQKSWLKEGSRAVLRPDKAPDACSSSHKPCGPAEGPGRGVPGETPHLLGGKGGRAVSPPLSGVGRGERGAEPACPRPAPHTPSPTPARLSHPCQRDPGTRRGRGRTPG